ncbi:hypothetical protein ACIHFD_26360 [Nonomuraea sp. NPDC051941]|uniref:hypothetical protein n=1 Tax=Nonomuraea sp. NPDC051941 TaxID=3364373 RepID=UPI0037C63157
MHSHEEARQVIDELTGRIYLALRDGALDAEPVIALACLLEEADISTPATRELLERPTAHLTTADVTRLGKRLLRDVRFEPTFALKPSLWVALEQALKLVERDVRSRGITGTLRLVIPDWDDSGHAWVEFRDGYHGNGIRPAEGRDAQEALASVADAAQEVIMELLWKVWPVCSAHDLGLRAELEHKIAVWRCTGNGTHTVARVGELPPERH